MHFSGGAISTLYVTVVHVYACKQLAVPMCWCELSVWRTLCPSHKTMRTSKQRWAAAAWLSGNDLGHKIASELV